MKREIQPGQLCAVSDDLFDIAQSFEMQRLDRLAIQRASKILLNLSRDRNLRRASHDEKYPVLAGCDAPTGDDRADRDEAARLLMGEMITHEAGACLRRLRPDDEHGEIPGWRWLRAARTVRGPKFTDDQRGSLRFLAAVARKFREADRQRPLKEEAAAVRAGDIEALWAS